MVAGVALLGTLLFMGGAAAHAAGCAQTPSCPYLEATVFGKEPATGVGVFRSPQAVATSPGGSFVWVADQVSGVVQKFDQQGNWLSDLGWYADKAQLGRLGGIGGLATDRNNHLYVLDSQYGRVQVFRSDTGQWIGAWGAKGTNPGLFDLGTSGGAGGIAVHHPTPQDAPVAIIADQNNHRVQRFTLDRLSTLDASAPVLPAGTADPGNANYISTPDPPTTWGSRGDCTPHGCGQPGDQFQFNFPQGIAVNPQPDTSGQTLVYVADSLNHRVVQYTDAGAYMGEVGGLGTGDGQFNSPQDVAVDSSGNLFVADLGNHRLQRFNAADLNFLSTWGTVGSLQDQFESPRALGSPTGASGVYVADSGIHRVQGFSATGVPTAVWGTPGRGGAGYFTRPSGLAVDRSGNLFVADTWAHRIEKLSSAGTYLAQWGRVTPRTGFTGLGTADGQFNFPRGVAFDPAGGNVWIADQNNHRIQLLTTAGAWLATYGGFGSAVGQFQFPRAITVGPNGDVYVADTGNHRIQKRDSSGAWSLVPVGTSLDTPAALAVDGSGTLFVADRTRVLRVEGGTATQIDPPTGTFDRPGGLHVTGNRLFVGDTGNSRVLRLDRTSGSWDVIGGEGPQVGSFLAPSELSTTQDGRTLYVTDQHNNRIQRFILELPPGPRSNGRASASAPQQAGRDRDRPRLRLRARLRQRALRRGAVLISINCTERCLVDARGKVMFRRTRRNLPLRRIRRQLAPNTRVTLSLRLSKKAKRRVGHALARGRRVNARIVVTGRDLAGNSTREARRVRIRP
jgi:DNA-binding beta-propeller fold protein YncE